MEFQRYFQSYKDYFWEWENQIFSEDSVFETITIPKGQTIGYEKFVFEILYFLSDDTIPPFGSLLLAISATNPGNAEAIAMIENLAKSKEIKKPFEHQNFFRVGASIDFLKLLSSLPDEYKSGEKRMKLFQTIFHECHNRIATERAKLILNEYKEQRHHLVRTAVKEDFNESNFIKDFRTLALLKIKFPTVRSILDAMANVPHEDLKEKLEEEVLEENNTSEKVPDFVEQLIEDDRTFQVGSLIKRLWSGFNIPLHHNHPSEQPLGGISDLTNKGDFDKLVISEFAYDDDVFMSRIANSEALYIQREVPPEADKFERILLIDTSLKNWGNPKILSFASAIAIARHPKTDIECKVYILGDTFKEISLDNINDVISSLSELSGKLECSTGLDLFFQQHKINSRNQEVFLFSSEESMKMAPMQKVFNDYFSEIKYVFEMEMEGIKIYKNQNKGRKMLQHIIMPLNELWKRQKNDFPVKKRESVYSEIPLLYPVERSYQNIFHDGTDFYLYIHGNLFLFVSTVFDKGFRKIASNLPFGSGEFAIRSNNKGQKLLFYFSNDLNQNVAILNLTTQDLRTEVVSYNKLPGIVTTVFEFNRQFYLSKGESFWHIAIDFKLQLSSSARIKEALGNYAAKRNVFINDFANSKFKYSVVKRIKGVSIVNGFLEINGFKFIHLEFSKKHYHYHNERSNNPIRFDEKVNLILKNKGTAVLDLVKIIKQNTDKSLVESKSFVDEELGVILHNVTRQKAEDLKKVIESKGAICYIETLFFESKDGSKVTNQDGILVFESSKEKIAKFYVPFIIGARTVMASDIEYSGSDYFISDAGMESIEQKEFLEKYMEPFLDNVKQHGA